METQKTRDEFERFKNERAELVFDDFTEETAWQIGKCIRERARQHHDAISIRIEAFDRLLFAASMPGAEPINDAWARRKGNTAKLFGKSSYEMALYTKLRGYDFTARYGLEASDYAASGGSIPIILKGNVVGAITVSGLAENEDHDLVAAAIQEVLKG